MTSELFHNIQKSAASLIEIVSRVPLSQRTLPIIEGTGGNASVADLLAYQIGWGQCVIRWYEAGIRGERPDMPGEGFTKWDYVAIAKHFYAKYRYHDSLEQIAVFQKTVAALAAIVVKEHEAGRLESVGIWPWTTLASGKQWPLAKWIQVNTVAPYRRAILQIKRSGVLTVDKNFLDIPRSPV